MANKKAEKCLEDRGIIFQESFSAALKKLAKDFQKDHGIKNVEQVYSLIGKKTIYSQLAKNPNSVQTKKYKINIVHGAAKLFELLDSEKKQNYI